MDVLGLILLIALGALVGWIASIITKRDAQQGVLGNIIVGIVGSLIGVWLSRLLTGSNHSGLTLDLGSLLWALVGAILFSYILNWVQGRNYRGRLR